MEGLQETAAVVLEMNEKQKKEDKSLAICKLPESALMALPDKRIVPTRKMELIVQPPPRAVHTAPTLASQSSTRPLSYMYLDYPLRCPITSCKAFCRVYNFFEHMHECHRELYIGETYENEPLNIDISLTNKPDFNPFCHGFFTLKLANKSMELPFRQRIPILILSRLACVRNEGITHWRGEAMTKNHFLVYFVGLQFPGVPKLQVEMTTPLFGTRKAALLCAQKPSAVVNLMVTHSGIFFNSRDISRYAEEPRSKLKIKLVVGPSTFHGFNINNIEL